MLRQAQHERLVTLLQTQDTREGRVMLPEARKVRFSFSALALGKMVPFQAVHSRFFLVDTQHRMR